MDSTRLVSFVVAVGLLGCGRAAPQAPVPAARVDLAQAKQPSLALLLAAGPGGAPVRLPLPAGVQAVTVAPLMVRSGGGETPTGGLGEITLRTEVRTDGTVQVGVVEDTADGAGPSWRAGVWAAATVAVEVLDKDLTDVRFEASARGHVDGPSASGLMAAGFIAAIVGWPIDDAATMTGMINLDGTIGPVGGLPEKFTAALAAGKRKLGYPPGQRRAVSMATGKEVDLVALARDGGGQAVEVPDVYAAVELMTGKVLPRPQAVPMRAMELSLDVVDELAERTRALDVQLDERLEDVTAAVSDARARFAIEELIAIAHREHARGYARLRDPLALTAYEHLSDALIAIETAATIVAIVDAIELGDVEAAQGEVDRATAAVDAAMAALRARGDERPATMGDHLRLLSAFEAAVDGWIGQDGGGRARALRAAIDDGDAVDDVLYAVIALASASARARMSVQQADDRFAFEAAPSAAYRCSLPNVRRLATSFAAVASSSLAYVDAVGHLDSDGARAFTADVDRDYQVALLGSRVGDAVGVAGTLRAAWGEGSMGWRLFTLAAAQQAHFRSARVLARWVSLDAFPSGDDWRVANPVALGGALEWAEQRAREHAAVALAATGEIPVQARLRYQAARGLREGITGDKLAALAAYWEASHYARAAVMLARN